MVGDEIFQFMMFLFCLVGLYESETRQFDALMIFFMCLLYWMR